MPKRNRNHQNSNPGEKRELRKRHTLDQNHQRRTLHLELSRLSLRFSEINDRLNRVRRMTPAELRAKIEEEIKDPKNPQSLRLAVSRMGMDAFRQTWITNLETELKLIKKSISEGEGELLELE